MSADLYELLGIAKDADAQTLKSAYRRLAMQYHPDRNPGDAAAEEKFKEVGEAYEVLSDPEKRRLYDQFGLEGLKRQGYGFGHSSVEDIFSHFGDMFGDFFGFGRRGRRGPPRGADLRYDLTLSLKDCLEGTSPTLDLNREKPCETCDGSGAAAGSGPTTCATCGGHGQVTVARGFITMATTCPRCRGQGKVIGKPCETCRGQGRTPDKVQVKIHVPPGVDDGMKLRVTGQGEQAPGGHPGDLHVVISVEEHPRFQRHGADLVSELGIDMVQACLGDRVTFESLEGPVEVEVKPGTQPGSVVHLRGMGMPRLDSGGRGDLLLQVSVKIPNPLSDAQRKILEEFRAATTS